MAYSIEQAMPITPRKERSPRSLEERVERLEHQQGELEQQTGEVAADLSRRAEELRKQIADQGDEMGGRIEQLEQTHREQLEQSLRLQWPGTFLFGTGVLFSVGGNSWSSASALCPGSWWGVSLSAAAVLAIAGLIFIAALRGRT